MNGLSFPTEAVQYETADPLPGRAALLRDFTKFPVPLTREVLHERRQKIFDLKSSLTEAVHARRQTWKQSLLFPFDPYGQGREIRVHQGAYLSKFPASLFDVLPELLPTDKVSDAHGEFVVTAERAEYTAVETRLDRRRAREAGDLGDAAVRRAVELQALRQAKTHLEADGSLVTDVGSSRSFDLLLSPMDGGADRQVIVRGSTERVGTIDLSSTAVDDIHRAPTDLILVHDIPCKRDDAKVITSAGDLDSRRGWQPTISSLTPVHYRHTLGW
ncbi:hypothetical protein [Brachybacterium tyrofermentans]|uniref:hypothetical protein n=1 Tax=Brachybacterium tyrofermentans TaxID=47848 RepID=UPI003FD022C6